MLSPMKTNSQLQTDITEAIRWEPLLRETKITVEAHDGIITLSGIAGSYIKKSLAIDAAKKINGVKAVVEKIEVRLDNND